MFVTYGSQDPTDLSMTDEQRVREKSIDHHHSVINLTTEWTEEFNDPLSMETHSTLFGNLTVEKNGEYLV